MSKATVLRDAYNYLSKTSFFGSGVETAAKGFNGVVNLFSHSPKDSFMKFVDPKSNIGFSTMTPALLALGMNTAITMHTSATAIQDARRINNMGLENSDFSTSYADAYTSLGLSGSAAALGTLPAISATSEVVGEFLDKNGGPGQTRTAVGKGLKVVSKAAGAPVKGFFKGTGFVGKGIDTGINWTGALFGKNWNCKGFEKVLGKHLIFVPLLSTAAYLYRKFTIDETKNPTNSLTNLKIGGKYLFRDNDKYSPNFGRYIGAVRAENKRKAEDAKPSIFAGLAAWVQNFYSPSRAQ